MAVSTAVQVSAWSPRGMSNRDLVDLEASMRRHPAGRRRPLPRPLRAARHTRQSTDGHLTARGPRSVGGAWRGLRMRLVLVALATAALLAVNWWLGGSAGAAAMRPEGVQAPRSVASVDSASAVRVVVVQPGDTLWAIAQQIAPEEDPRITIQVIRETNAMDGAGLQAGQRLVIPTSLG